MKNAKMFAKTMRKRSLYGDFTASKLPLPNSNSGLLHTKHLRIIHHHRQHQHQHHHHRHHSSPLISMILCIVLLSLLFEQIRTEHDKQQLEFEAAFQGECRKSSPCQQLCFDLHDGTFECACNDGYHLDINGYSCVDQPSPLQQQHERILERPPSSSSSGSSRLSSSKTKKFDASFPAETRRTRTRNRTFILSEPNDDDDDIINKTSTIHHTEHSKSVMNNNIDSSNYSPISSSNNDDDPGSLYSCNDIECEAGGVCIESLSPSSNNIIEDYYDNNDDAGGGDMQQTNKQFQQQQPAKNRVRCKCPLGRGGQFCEKIVEVKLPRFMGSSYLALPTLRNAHRSLKINLEFKPESFDGVLLYSGQETNLDGDFIAIILNQGFVEFRFDCGMGEGVIRSDLPIILNSWNTIDIYRDGRNAWMQVNQGQQKFGHSKGLFSRITFRLETFLGGSPNISKIENRIKVNKGLIGCVSKLKINDRNYDLYNDTIDGIDIDQCNSDACNHVTCLNGGHCAVDDNNNKLCICPLGYTGEYCETQIEFHMPSFNGSSHLQFIGFGDKETLFTEIFMIIKPSKPDGLFLYNGQRMDKTGDFISLNLVDGYVEFRYDLGSGAAILRSPEKINMKEWHQIYATRTGREGLLVVDDQPSAQGESLGGFTQLSLPLNLYIGGVPHLKDIHHNVRATVLYNGCVQRLVINGHHYSLLEDVLSGVNIDNCQHYCQTGPCKNNGHCEPLSHHFRCHCMPANHDGHDGGDDQPKPQPQPPQQQQRQRFIGQHCEQETGFGSNPMFYGNSFLKYSDQTILNRIRGFRTIIHLDLRAFSSSGLILWYGESLRKSRDYLAIGLNDGHVYVDINLHNGGTGGHTRLALNDTRLDDGQWHKLNMVRLGGQISIQIDYGIVMKGSIDGLRQQLQPSTRLNIQSALYLGGLEDTTMVTNGYYQHGFIGCISNMTVDQNHRVDLVQDSERGINIRNCI